MSEIEQLIKSAKDLSDNLEKASLNEKKYFDELCLELERYSCQVFVMANHLNEIKQNYGV